MKKFNKLRLLLVIPACLMLAAVAGIFMISFDHKSNVAEAILFDTKDDALRDKILLSAITTHFPIGSDFKNVRSFVEKLDGHCENRTTGSVDCSIGLTATICVSTTLHILANVSADGTISNISAESRFMAC
ncbi:hypothetical protein [Methylomonas rivi]|uniref:Uncharacterized protein n=1 Tax=Methylomonas rivi TaxID=2952226 RepID=A0ABT1U7E7_9GAMM|nr:hypothetical protein [Methylomonas sp. WSC-6]MCQ8129305.1 hypothetical protein [Methylomonas sp. WSC-6]